MFDDPKKELQRLQQQLLASEAQEDDSWLEELESDPEEDELNQIRMLLGDRERVRMQPLPVPEKKEKGIGGLVALAILETAGILAILGWWLWYLM